MCRLEILEIAAARAPCHPGDTLPRKASSNTTPRKAPSLPRPQIQTMTTTATNYPDPKIAANYLAKAEQTCWELPGVPKDYPLPDIKKVGVLGAGERAIECE